MEAAAPATHVWRRPVGHCQRPWPQVFLPRRAVTGAMLADLWRASAAAYRSRCAPQATRRRGAQTAPASGRAANQGQAGWRGARGAMAWSQSLRQERPVISDRPFDSAWKFARVTVREDGRPVSYLKGAPEVLLARCDLSEEERAAWTE